MLTAKKIEMLAQQKVVEKSKSRLIKKEKATNPKKIIKEIENQETKQLRKIVRKCKPIIDDVIKNYDACSVSGVGCNLGMMAYLESRRKAEQAERLALAEALIKNDEDVTLQDEQQSKNTSSNVEKIVLRIRRKKTAKKVG